MIKVVTFALALTLTMSLSALAAETTGQVKAIDAAGQTFTLEDGTQLSLSAEHLADLTPGERVLATYETKADRKVVTELSRITRGLDGQLTTNFGTKSPYSADSFEGVGVGD
ncbi:MAG: DUF1344 domain-containing protein [Candidatus Rokubacteria bacterium]|nr:DUF1344 domain-containing protein [Candidatus Rokubacteria bacterium]